MEEQSQEQIEQSIQRLKLFKQLLDEKGTKEETVQFLVTETVLSKEDCEKAYDFYHKLELPKICTIISNGLCNKTKMKERHLSLFFL